MHLFKKQFKPGQLFSYKNHVYQVRKPNEPLDVCRECSKENRHPCVAVNFYCTAACGHENYVKLIK